MSDSIVVIGSSNTDMVLKLNKIPRAGETVIGGTFFTAQGGKGANQAVAAAKCGGNVSFIAKIGCDLFGDNSIKGYQENGVDVKHIIRNQNTPSGIALIFVDGKGENAIGVASGANASLSREDIHSKRDVISNAAVLLMQLEIPLDSIIAAAEIAHGKKIRIILNPAPSQQLPDHLLSKISIITPNETEAEQLTGIRVVNEEDALNAGEVLLKKGVECAIITLGSKGAIIVTNDFFEVMSSFKVKAVDTTAAGDTFNGALAVELAKGNTIRDAIRFANAAAALSVTRIGAQSSIPSRIEVERLLSEQLFQVS